MQINRKDATITQAPTDDGPGTWTAILSAPTKDRDGDTLTAPGWKQPLPAKIPIDIDHEMSVRGTIGSAIPSIDAAGNLVVAGTFASTPLAQEVRTLMAEGHIDRMSVAFMTEKTTKDGQTETVRELLNGAVVCIPSNREAAVLEVRSAKLTGELDLKEGRRNSGVDLGAIQAIHDHAVGLGADCGQKSWRPLEPPTRIRHRDLQKVLPANKSATVQIVTDAGMVVVQLSPETPGSPASPDDDLQTEAVTGTKTPASTGAEAASHDAAGNTEHTTAATGPATAAPPATPDFSELAEGITEATKQLEARLGFMDVTQPQKEG